MNPTDTQRATTTAMVLYSPPSAPTASTAAPGSLHATQISPWTLEGQERLRFHAINGRAANTRLAYERQWRAFAVWCQAQGVDAFPAETDAVILYLDSLAQAGRKAATIHQALAAIKALHSDYADAHPDAREALVGLTSRRMTTAIASLLRTIGARGGNRVSKPRAFTQGEITAMATACPVTAAGIQDRALLLLGANAGLRASEFVALAVGDLAFDSEGVSIFVRSSKTDQMATGETIFVARLPKHQGLLCAVTALEKHLAKNRSEAPSEASLFLAFRRGGVAPHLINGAPHGLRREAVTGVVVRCAERAGLPETTQRISSHSLRHSFITRALEAGVSPTDVARTSRHRRLETLAAYDQSSLRKAAVSPRLWN